MIPDIQSFSTVLSSKMYFSPLSQVIAKYKHSILYTQHQYNKNKNEQCTREHCGVNQQKIKINYAEVEQRY